jgi:hypothetical protein
MIVNPLLISMGMAPSTETLARAHMRAVAAMVSSFCCC